MTDAPRIIPIVLCGGAGTRLWPESRESYPKQFLPLAGEKTLLQQTVLRVADRSRFDEPIVVANDAHRFIVAEQLGRIGIAATIALEPCRRDSAAAIAAASKLAALRDPDALALVLASDHAVTDPAGFLDAIDRALPGARAGMIVTFGVAPTEPTSKYGYVRLGDGVPEAPGLNLVSAFIEKPDRGAAEQLIDEGCYWNSGNFFASCETLLGELFRLAPSVARPAAAAAEGARRDLGFLRLAPDRFAEAEAISFDYAVMEKTDKAAVLPSSFGWSDVGSWSALWDVAEKDSRGNVLIGRSSARDGGNNYIRSEKHLTAVVGVDDLVVVATADAVLVTSRARADGVKELVRDLAENGETAATEAPLSYRPWGSYEIIDQGPRFQVKRITVKAKRKLSLQSHAHRAEHWVVVEGTALVTIDGETRTIGENQSVFIPAGAKHRLENPGDEPIHLIEVQSGAYLGEDDIVRYEDDYSRK